MKKIQELLDQPSGVSPVIGVILMVTITVATVALVTVIVFDISENSLSDSPDVSLNTEISQGMDRISISVYRNENVDRIHVIGDGVNGRQTVIDSPNDIGTVTISPTDTDGDIKIVGVTDGISQVIKTASYQGLSGDGFGVTEDIVSLDLRFNSSSDEIEANVTENNGADRVFIRGDGINGEENIVTSSTDTGSITIKPNSGSGSVEAVAESDGNQQLIDQVSYSGVPTVSSSKPSSNAPDCGTITYNGSGISSDPYKITNDHELQCMKNDLSSDYQLTKPINASLTDQWNGGRGFDPVGNYYDNPFTGSLDGDGYEIRGLTIDRPSQEGVGIFEHIDGGAEIETVRVRNASVSGGSSTGIIVGNGFENAVINNSYATGSVTGASSTYGSGGVAGQLDGSINNSYANVTVNGANDVGGLVGNLDAGVANNSYAVGDVTGSGDDVGGLAGYTEQGGVKNSFATGNVTASGSTRNTGGLVGSRYIGSISNSYATGDVSGDTNVGGFLGNGDSSDGTVSLSYSTGEVTGNNNVGGFVGASGTVIDSYWDTESSTQDTSASGATGLTTSEMQGSAAETNMTAFDFSSDWVTVSGDYPVSEYIDQQIQLDSR